MKNVKSPRTVSAKERAKEAWIEFEITPSLIDVHAVYMNLRNIAPFGMQKIQKDRILINVKPSQKESFTSSLNTLCENLGLNMEHEKI